MFILHVGCDVSKARRVRMCIGFFKAQTIKKLFSFKSALSMHRFFKRNNTVYSQVFGELPRLKRESLLFFLSSSCACDCNLLIMLVGTVWHSLSSCAILSFFILRLCVLVKNTLRDLYLYMRCIRRLYTECIDKDSKKCFSYTTMMLIS